MSRTTNLRQNTSLIFLAITFPFVLVGAYLSMTTFKNELAKWPSPSSQVRQDYDHFRDSFGPNEVVLVSWPSCNFADVRLKDIQADLEDDANRKFFVRCGADCRSMSLYATTSDCRTRQA